MIKLYLRFKSSVPEHKRRKIQKDFDKFVVEIKFCNELIEGSEKKRKEKGIFKSWIESQEKKDANMNFFGFERKQ